DSERPDDHDRQRVCELAFEHRAFASNHAIMPGHLARQKGRINIGQVHLPPVSKLTSRKVKILRHHGDKKILRAEAAADLAQNFFDADIRSSISRTVVTREKEFQLFAGP